MNFAMWYKECENKAEAEYWYRAAAELNDPNAMFGLAELLKDRGAEAEAEQWYRKAADLGHFDLSTQAPVE